MAYDPKAWTAGEVITAAGLNNLEEGVQQALDTVVFIGRVNSNGTAALLPAGWTSGIESGSGHYRVTFASAFPDEDYVVMVGRGDAGTPTFVRVALSEVGYFTVWSRTAAGDAISAGFSFLLVRQG